MSRLMALKEFADSKLIMCYVDFRNEVMTKAFMKKCLAIGKRIAVPVVAKNDGEPVRLLASELYSLEADLRAGSYGILEPANESIREVDAVLVDMVIVPGVVFDIRKNRIGYGAGYYDRFLRAIRPDSMKIGVAFELQVLESVPADYHDIPMDIIVTEGRLI